jgi:hypothetical protein
LGAYRHLLESSPGFTLGAALEFTETDFDEDFRTVWGLDTSEPPEGMSHDDWLTCKRIHGMASQVAEAALLLVRQKGIGRGRLAVGDQLSEEARAHDQMLSELLGSIRPHLAAEEFARVSHQLDLPSPDDPRSRRAIFENTLQLAARRIFPPSMDVVASRMESLVEFVVASQNERCNAFLGRVATCYCLNLRTELSVMCRAVLEAAIQDIASDDAVREVLSIPKHVRLGLAARVEYLDSLGLIQAEVRASIDRVKRGGDDAVHVAPGLEPDPDVLLADLVTALNAVTQLRNRI